ncbi:MAG: Phosphorylated carbohydrates phosphatase [Chlamydiia bacterium]|nr:Phosphorylated carbohydrates phosphatase [Chlamydiia bacterium]
MDILSYDAYLFDFDGLLVNTEDLHFIAYKEMLNRYNCELVWDFATYCSNAHKSTEYLANAVYKEFPTLYDKRPDWLNLREEKQEIYTNLLLSGKTELMPGVEEFLNLLKSEKKPLFVVTNSPKTQVEIIKKQKPVLSHIETWITRECYKESKPSPDGYLTALKAFGSEDNTVGFEDTPKGLESLIQTPITPVCIIPNRYPKLEGPLKDKATCFESFYEIMKP